ncbi:surface exclusion protein [Salmonella enterica subsp. enterica serovar Java]|nr:surface exclusion protein [Salmonella enterica subsp. enterica serovar Java]
MKSLIRLCWGMGLQFIACRLAEWPLPETLFMLSVVFLWNGLFLWIFSKIKTKSKSARYDKVLWYVLMPLASLLSPLVTLSVIIIGTISEVRKVCGYRSVRNWIKSEVIISPLDDAGKARLNYESVEFERRNPATGLPMTGGVDISGNPYGSSHH